jgi:hypothetical protein
MVDRDEGVADAFEDMSGTQLPDRRMVGQGESRRGANVAHSKDLV